MASPSPSLPRCPGFRLCCQSHDRCSGQGSLEKQNVENEHMLEKSFTSLACTVEAERPIVAACPPKSLRT